MAKINFLFDNIKFRKSAFCNRKMLYMFYIRMCISFEFFALKRDGL